MVTEPLLPFSWSQIFTLINTHEITNYKPAAAPQWSHQTPPIKGSLALISVLCSDTLMSPAASFQRNTLQATHSPYLSGERLKKVFPNMGHQPPNRIIKKGLRRVCGVENGENIRCRERRQKILQFTQHCNCHKRPFFKSSTNWPGWIYRHCKQQQQREGKEVQSLEFCSLGRLNRRNEEPKVPWLDFVIG